MELLPSELIEEVAEYLSLDDINACSVVNRQWRKAFDSNRIWKRFYTFHPNYFSKQVMKVSNSSEYCFDGCKSKKHVFQELQVGKNLVNRKYELVRVDIGRLYCDNLLDVVDEVGNHWLFVSCAKNYNFENHHRLEVWNMNGEPTKHQSIDLPITKRPIDSQMRAIKDKLYYIVDNILTALEFKCPEYNLTFLFQTCYPHTLGCLRGIFRQTAMVFKDNRILEFVFTWMHNVRKEKPWVNIWDENSTLLFKNYSNDELDQALAPNVDNGSIYLVSSMEVRDGGSSSNNVLLVYEAWNGETLALLVDLFNLQTFEYSSLLVTTERVHLVYCEFVNEVVVIFFYRWYREVETTAENNNTRVPTLFCCSSDRTWSYEPKVTSRSNYAHHSITTASDGKEVLVLDSGGEIIVFDVFEQKEISRFKITCDDIIGTVIRNNLIIIQQHQRHKTVQSLWNFKLGKHLYDFGELQSLSREMDGYKFSFTRSYRSPPKIFAIKDPQCYYARQCNGEIVMISFL